MQPVVAVAGSVCSFQHESLCRFLLNLHALLSNLLVESSGYSVLVPLVVVVVVVVVVGTREEGQNVGQCLSS